MKMWKQIVIVILSFFIGIVVRGLNWEVIILFFKDSGLTGNIFDFFGSIIIAATSAGIAWFVSERDKKRLNKETIQKRTTETIIGLKLLKIEIKIHETKLKNIIGITNPTFEQVTLDIQKLNSSMWERNYSNLYLEEILLEKFQKYYISVYELGQISEEELFSNNMKYIKQIRSKSEQAIIQIDKTIKEMEKELSNQWETRK